MSTGLETAFGKPAVQLAIAPVAEFYEVGQPVGVRITAVGLRDSSIVAATADLVQTIWRESTGGPAPGLRTVTRTGSDLSLGGPLPAGARADCEALVPNWAHAPSGGGERGNPGIEYQVRAELRLADGSTVRCQAPVRLVSGPSLYREIEGTQRRRRCRRFELDLVNPVLSARPGETVCGTLRVVPRRPTRASRVVLNVIRRPRVRHGSFFRGARLAVGVEMSGPQEFPFEVRLRREMAPTVVTRELSVRWYLRAEVHYRLLTKDSCDWEFNVYTSPP
jgi:hypothetical protein